MSWHYQIRRTKQRDGSWFYDVVEVFCKPFGYTESGIAPVGESRSEVIKCLERMLKDAKKYKTLTNTNEGIDAQNINDDKV